MARLALLLAAMALWMPLHASAQKNGADIVHEARKQIGVTITYSPDYVSLTYPEGDIPLDRGVCSDVVIRALRGCGVDLQKLVHEDMKANFSRYPNLWKLKITDRNIDHRRVPNLATFFQRKGKNLPVSNNPENYQPGDFVVCRLPNHLIHIMTVSDKKTADGRPLVIHNIGSGAKEEDRLFDFTIEGHYRWFAD